MKTKAKISIQNLPVSSVCKQCGRELPQEFFYVNRQTQCLDIYCKGCRKEIGRRRYNSGQILLSCHYTSRRSDSANGTHFACIESGAPEC